VQVNLCALLRRNRREYAEQLGGVDLDLAVSARAALIGCGVLG
jgi:hypothetical protein